MLRTTMVWVTILIIAPFLVVSGFIVLYWLGGKLINKIKDYLLHIKNNN